MNKKTFFTSVIVCGNVQVGKSSLIQCFMHERKMRGVAIKPTQRFDIENKTLPLDENTDLAIKFIDVAGESGAQTLIE